MPEYIKVRDHKNLRRQSGCKGIVNIDNIELNKYKVERENKMKLASMIEEHDSMKSDIAEIKNLLKELLGKV